MPKLRENTDLIRKPKYAQGWLRSALEHAYTQQQWVEIFRNLPPAVQIKTLVDLQPKETKAENTNIIRLLIENVTAQPAIVQREIKQLTEPDDDDP